VQRALVVDQGSSGRVEVALTFDAGEGAGYTMEILDLLAAFAVSGSFGVTGQWAERHPLLMQRIVDDGHQIFNHAWDHASFTGRSTAAAPLDPDARRDQIERTEQAIAKVTGGYSTRPYFRFP
jgi:peptidoglycan/xylan/chitin deacetylase (PgdA/CDA1 family)